jgi:hypothetical protein
VVKNYLDTILEAPSWVYLLLHPLFLLRDIQTLQVILAVHLQGFHQGQRLPPGVRLPPHLPQLLAQP